MIAYSNFWHATVKIGTILLSACVGPALGGDHWFVWAGASPSLSGALSVGIGMLVVLFLTFPRTSIASSWLYARLTLGAHVSWGDAKQLRVLFQLDDKETW